MQLKELRLEGGFWDPSHQGNMMAPRPRTWWRWVLHVLRIRRGYFVDGYRWFDPIETATVYKDEQLMLPAHDGDAVAVVLPLIGRPEDRLVATNCKYQKNKEGLWYIEMDGTIDPPDPTKLFYNEPK